MTGQNGRTRTQPQSRDGRLAAFVADLEQLRRGAGQPSLRKMSETGHYSHTALSSVLSGARLPSQDLTLAFVRACGGDEDAWRERWEREDAIIRRNGSAATRPAHSRPRLPRWALVAGSVLIVLAVLTAVGVAASRRGDPVAGPTAPPTAGANPTAGVTSAVEDGADPQEKRCQLDAMSAKTVEVRDPDGAPPYGSLTLRYSPRCRAAWPLFISTERVPTGATILLKATRPSDGAVSRFDYPFLVRPQVYSVFGNVLQTGKGCVSVTVEIHAAQASGSLAHADTPCMALGSGA